MLSLKDSLDIKLDNIPLTGQLGSTSTAQGSLLPAPTSFKSDQDKTNGNSPFQYKDISETVNLKTSTLAAINDSISDELLVTESVSLQDSNLPDYGDFVDFDEDYEVEERSGTLDDIPLVPYIVLSASDKSSLKNIA